MKQLFFGALAALALAALTVPAEANFSIQYGNTRHFGFTHVQRNRGFTMSHYSMPVPLPPTPNSMHYAGPVPFDALRAYPAPAAPPAVAPVAPVAPVVPHAAPAFQAPQPKLSGAPQGVMQAGYSYYGQTNNVAPNYSGAHPYSGASYPYYGAGYNYYGYGANHGYAQVPNYWY